MKYKAAVITVSDKGFSGLREDLSGPVVCETLEAECFEVVRRLVVPDVQADIEAELIKCADELKLPLVVTTGGTGFAPRDLTPEATLAVITRRTPGIPEAMRLESLKVTNRAMLSRCEAGLRGSTMIINLPGSPKAAKENLLAIIDALQHGMEMLLGPQVDHE